MTQSPPPDQPDMPSRPATGRQKLFIAAANHVVPAAPAATEGPKSVGMILAHTRTVQGFTIGEVAARLRIRPAMLLALEQDDYAALPAPAYALGFLRSYAGFLALDSDQLVQQYRHEATTPGGGDYCLPSIEYPQHQPSQLLIWFSIVALAGVAIASAWIVTHRDRITRLVPPLPERLQSPQQSPEGRIFGDGNSNHLVLAARGQNWVEVRDEQGSLLLAHMLQAGDRYHVPVRTGLRLSTGDAGMLAVLVDGTERGLLGTVGVALRDVDLSVDGITKIMPALPPAPKVPVDPQALPAPGQGF